MHDDTKSAGLPKISVVTIAYNDASRLERTIQSVLSQDYPNMEYILVDGGSTDGTVNIIQKYDSKITKWVSEKDTGIYDAMNKGVTMATGEWVNFMNAGDSFAAPTVLREVLTHTPENVDIVYGNCEAKYPTFTTVALALEPDGIWKGMPACHQSIIARTMLVRECPFDTRYKIAADHQFIYRQWRSGKVFLKVDVTIAIFMRDGISEQKILQKFWEVWKSASSDSLSVSRHCFHMCRLLIATAEVVFRWISPTAHEYAMRLRHRFQNFLRRRQVTS